MAQTIWEKDDEFWMREALIEAEKAGEKKEVPIGAIVVQNGTIIGRGHNERETLQQGVNHAEITAITSACRNEKSWRLPEATLYVTLEPCPMCAGAIVQTRIPRVVYGAPDPKAGCCGTLMNLLDEPRFNHQASVTSGILQEECANLLKNFFRNLRERKKQFKNQSTERTGNK
ncbi:tRNA adenosine(34) deaminase TadA [Alteribacter lacisalsi]|uniref:tRNA-specific adenosine deaminase n=1 Tax=Alteribacter lacisalsi TaxID=2045244 RepID=A0A2W0H0S3_9BACI|nr:tRNA adenosine(34) deaminase TadA [Alteribacter lacisalsi]PYZ95383.1 tRNA adenosine(34) deaminase TadA [Alteribacter lacisalsi]